MAVIKRIEKSGPDYIGLVGEDLPNFAVPAGTKLLLVNPDTEKVEQTLIAYIDDEGEVAWALFSAIGGGGDGDGANTELSNLETTAINTDLIFAADSAYADKTIKIADQAETNVGGNDLVLQAGSGNGIALDGNIIFQPQSSVVGMVGIGTSDPVAQLTIQQLAPYGSGAVISLGEYDPGSGYVQNDILTIIGGNNDATVRVNSVDELGAITDLSIVTNGSGYIDDMYPFSGGSNMSEGIAIITNYKAPNVLTFLNEDGSIGLEIRVDNQVLQNGTNNILIGKNAGKNRGSDNWNLIGIGTNALSNCQANDNIAIGANALQICSPEGVGNVAVGTGALALNTDGQNNLAIGNGTLQQLISGTDNVAVGVAALQNEVNGICNVGIGQASLALNNGTGNVGIGYFAGINNFAGNLNVFVGHRAGENEEGSYKLYIDSFENPRDGNNALIYGEFDNKILRINGELQIGNGINDGIIKIPDVITDGEGKNLVLTPGLAANANSLDSATINNGGSGYSQGDILAISGGNATCLAGTVTDGVIDSVTLINPGSGYSNGTNISTSCGVGDILSVSIANNGIGYQLHEQLSVVDGNGDAILEVLNINEEGGITELSIITPGTGYITANNVSLSGSAGMGVTVNIVATTIGSGTNATVDIAVNVYTDGVIKLNNPTGIVGAIIDTSSITDVDKTISLPNKSGTIALLDDISKTASHDYNNTVTDWTLSINELQSSIIKVTNASDNVNAIFDVNSQNEYLIDNQGGYNLTCKNATGAAVVVANTKRARIWNNGIDIIRITADI